MFVLPLVASVLHPGYVTAAALWSLYSKYTELLFLLDARAQRSNSADRALSRLCMNSRDVVGPAVQRSSTTTESGGC